MKIIVVFSLIVLLPLTSIAQNETKDLDFIIVVDDAIWTSPTAPKFILKDKKDSIVDTFFTKYHAGNLSVNKLDYKKLSNVIIDKMVIELEYSEICKDKVNHYNYNIDLKKESLKGYFFILKIYNTEKKKYKDIYMPLKDKTYTYALSSSERLEIITRKKPIKGRCF